MGNYSINSHKHTPLSKKLMVKKMQAGTGAFKAYTQLKGHLLIKMASTCCLSLAVAACNSLPTEPHTENSLRLSQLLKERYASNTSHLSDKDNNQKQTTQNSTDTQESKPPAAVSIEEAQFAEAVTEQNELHPNLSGYHPIITGTNAFATRSILTDMAQKSIDVQYYIWHDDQAGQLLLKKLWDAAERGVVVRFLLDDFNNNAKLDKHLRRFSSHPNIAVRLINPLSYRKFQTLNYLTNLRRINHRMHNKSMTFDRQISVIGGRNVGDEYLSNNESSQFADLDVLLIGDVVADITTSFEDYWQSPLSYDIETLVDKPRTLTNNNTPRDDFISKLDKITPSQVGEEAADVYNRALQRASIGNDLINKRVPFRWAPMTFLSDDVNKLVNTADSDTHLVYQLRNLLGKPNKDLTIVSSYFVPTKEGVDTLIKLSKSGVNVKILTNSFNATDVAAVHSGYAQWRVPLLKAGIEVYELKAIASEEDRENKLWRARSQSSTSLHAKTFAVDDHNVFIGSYNVDPRSANINTEMGVVIEDEDLALELHDAVSKDLLPLAYRVVLTDNNQLQWQTHEAGKTVIYNKEPDVDFADTIWLKIMSWLPIDWLL